MGGGQRFSGELFSGGGDPDIICCDYCDPQHSGTEDCRETDRTAPSGGFDLHVCRSQTCRGHRSVSFSGCIDFMDEYQR